MNAFSISPIVVEQLGWVLVHSLWQFTLIAMLVGVLLRVLRRHSAALRYSVLGVAMIATTVVPIATWWLQPVAAPENPVRQANLDFGPASLPMNSGAEVNVSFDDQLLSATDRTDGDTAIEVPALDVPLESVSATAPTARSEIEFDWTGRATSLLRPWLAWIVAGWSLGVVLCSLRPLLGWHTLRRLRHVGVAPVSGEVSATLRRVSERLGLRRAVDVMHSTLVKVPIVVGYFRPVILLPVSLVTSIPATQLEAILAHELAHVRRHDFLVNLLQTLVETAFFYHPAVWWLSSRLREERENCCDDLAVATLGNRVEYGRALLAIEELRGRSTVLAVGAGDGSLLVRVRRIAGRCPDRVVSSPWPVLSFGFCILGATLAISVFSFHALAQPPEDAAKSPVEVEPSKETGDDAADDTARFTAEQRIELKRASAHGDGWFFVDLDRGRLATPPFPVEIDRQRLPYSVVQPKEEELNAWLVKNGIDLILYSQAKSLGDGTGAMNQEIQIRSVRTSLRSLATGLQQQPDQSWTWTTLPQDVVALFERKDETTHVSGFIPNSSNGEVRPDSPVLHPFRTADNVLGLFLLEQPQSLKDELSLRIVHVAGATIPLAEIEFATGSRAAADDDPDQNADSTPNEATWGSTTNGLRARVVPVLSSMSEDAIDLAQGVDSFQNSDDVAFAVELENVSDKPITLLDTRYGNSFGDSSGKTNSNWYGQFLFSIDLYDLNGKLIEKPQVEVVTLDGILGSVGVATVAPGKTHRFLLRPSKWLSVFLRNFEPGNHRVAVRYHGMPPRVVTRIKEYKAESPVFSAVAGDIVTPPVAFEVHCLPGASGTPNETEAAAKDQPELVWGEPTNGLRAAMSFVPSTTIHAHGEKPKLNMHVQNVSDAAITLASQLWMPDLSALVQNEQGERVDVGTAFYTGATPVARVTLKPRQIAVFYAGNIGLAINNERAGNFEHVTNRTLVAPAEKYTMQLSERFGSSFLLKDGKGKVLAPLEGDYVGDLKSGITPFEITNETIECNIVDAVTGMPVEGTTVNFRFIKPKSGDKPEEIVADMFWGPKSPSRIVFGIPDDVLQRADRDEIEVRWGVGGNADYEPYLAPERFPLEPFFHEGTKAIRETLSTVKLTPKKKAGTKMQLKPAFLLPGHHNMMDVRFDNNDRELVAVSSYQRATVRRCDVVGRNLISEINLAGDKQARPFAEGSFKLSGDGRRVVAATDEYVGIWDTSTGQLLKKMPYPTREGIYTCSINKLDCTPDLSVIAGYWEMPGRLTLVYDAQVMIWDGTSGELLRTVVDKNATTLQSIDLSTDGKRLATTNGSGAKVWNTSTGQLVRSFENNNKGRKHSDPEVKGQYNDHVWSVQLSNDGKQLAVGDILGVRLWDMQTGELQHLLDASYRYGTGALVYSKDGQLLARTGTSNKENGLVPIWSTRTGEKLFELQTAAHCGAFSNDNKQFAVGLSERPMALAVFQLSGVAADPPTQPSPNVNTPGGLRYHHRGKKAQELIDRWKPAWGEAQAGVQYGIAVASEQRQFRDGQRVPMMVFFRNVSDKPLQVDVRPDFSWDIPKVTGPNGTAVELEKVALLGNLPHYREKLQPGEAFGAITLSICLGENPRPGQQDWAPYWKTPVVGQSQLKHTIAFHVAGLDASREIASDDWTPGQLTTGTLKFEVVDGGKPIQGGTQLEPESTSAVDDSGSEKDETPVSKKFHFRLRGGEQAVPLPDVEVDVMQYKGSGRERVGRFRTDEAGIAKLELPQGTYRVQLKSEKELPYLLVDNAWNKKSRGPPASLLFSVSNAGVTKWDGTGYVGSEDPNDPWQVTFTLLPACELVLRAIDVDTGKGIPGVEFFRENAVGEDWAHPTPGENLGWSPVANGRKFGAAGNSKNRDGIFRRLESANAGFSYGVWNSPAGYEEVEPRREVEIDIVYGQRKAEHVFKFRRTEKPDDAHGADDQDAARGDAKTLGAVDKKPESRLVSGSFGGFA